MLIKSEYICEKGSARVNEDIANITDSGAWVLDGATGLNGHNLVDSKSDASWYVSWWNNYLLDNLCKNKPLQIIIRDGIVKVRNEFMKMCQSDSINDLDMPSCSFFAIRWNSSRTKLEYCGLGDCMFVLNKSNSLTSLYDKNLCKLDDNVLSKLGRLLNSMNITHEEGKSMVMHDIINNRLKKDTPDGYYILGFNEESAYHMMQGEIEVNDETDIMILSDGFYALFDKYKYTSLNGFLDNVHRGNSHKLYETLRNIENKDYNARMFPRFKVNDDASMVYLKFARAEV